MPSRSAAQARLMQAVAHGWKPDRTSVPVEVAKEFAAADKGTPLLQQAMASQLRKRKK